jgi:low affinity Fe/Cu permease
MSLSRRSTDFAERVAHATVHPFTFAHCVVVIGCALNGPFFRFSVSWQRVTNTGTTIVTFLMVVLIQNTRNRDGAAIQTKRDELIRASAAQNKDIDIEHLTEAEVAELRKRWAAHAKKLRDAKQASDAAEDGKPDSGQGG